MNFVLYRRRLYWKGKNNFANAAITQIEKNNILNTWIRESMNTA